MKGLIFSIEEFSVYDGPGIRTTVFFKGCPLRCNWCHSPESWKKEIQILKNPNGCLNCGLCLSVSPDKKLCEKSIDICPKNLIRKSGTLYTAEELIAGIEKNFDILIQNGGGVTLSGGEVFMQSDFLEEVIDKLKNRIHTAIQTCGFYSNEVNFKRIISKIDLIMFDLKIIDEQLAKKYTGFGSKLILKNFKILKQSGIPFVARVPLIPGVTDTDTNLTAIADLVKDAKNLITVELLPYNKLAGAKYPLAGLKYEPIFNQTQEPNINTHIFEKNKIPVKVF